MAEPTLAISRLAGSEGVGDLLVVGPGLGTSAETLWSACAVLLGDRYEVLGVDLPGHGRSAPAASSFSVQDLASAVRADAAASSAGRTSWYAGVSLGGAVALQLGLDPGPFSGVGVLASAARIGEADAWHERARLVRRAGTAAMVAASAERWFAPGFVDRDGETADQLLLALADADDESYALACEALASFDLLSRLGELQVPALIGSGEHDVVVPTTVAQETARLLPTSVFHVFVGCGHQPPAEDPGAVAAALATTFRLQESHHDPTR